MTEFGPIEWVYVELDFYDGPRSGIADVNGQPHRFATPFDDAIDDYLDAFLIWPINQEALSLEIEQWHIFVEWYALYEDGKADTAPHPATGGVNPRWDELDALLEPGRSAVPETAVEAEAVFEALGKQSGYNLDGPNYGVRWRFLTNIPPQGGA